LYLNDGHKHVYVFTDLLQLRHEIV